MNEETQRPEWAPAEASAEFASRIIQGKLGDDRPPDRLTPVPKRRSLTIDDYVNGVHASDRTILARAITLVESDSERHIEMAQEMLRRLLPATGNSIRIGITGVPGSGKSTFIEALGCRLDAGDHKIAVLAVDPSSSLTKGSVLGDKTRMEKLARRPSCFIRPSPSGGALGGVTRKSRETILVCEAAGYDIILVETVGVGQNEITVRSMVDLFLLLKIAGAGDELQGIKKGIIELADIILINKTDGDNRQQAEVARSEFANALHYLASPTPGWQPPVRTCSALNDEGLAEVWQLVEHFVATARQNGSWEQRRRRQAIDWVHELVRQHLQEWFYRHPQVAGTLADIEHQVLTGQLPPTTAAQQLLAIFTKNFTPLS